MLFEKGSNEVVDWFQLHSFKKCLERTTSVYHIRPRNRQPLSIDGLWPDTIRSQRRRRRFFMFLPAGRITLRLTQLTSQDETLGSRSIMR